MASDLSIQATFLTFLALTLTCADLLRGQHSTAKLVSCYQCHDGKVKLTHESQNSVLRAIAGSGSGYSNQNHRTRRGSRGRGGVPPVAEDVVCDSTNHNSRGSSVEDDESVYQCGILDYCILMTLISPNGTTIGHRRSCAEEFIAPYLMLLEQRITPAANQHMIQRQPPPPPYNSQNNYPNNNQYNPSSGGTSVVPSADSREDRMIDIASDQPQPNYSPPTTSFDRAAQAAAAVQRMLDTLCLSSDASGPSSGRHAYEPRSDLRLNCNGIYADAAICRIQCCSTPLCNSCPKIKTNLVFLFVTLISFSVLS